MTNEDIVMQIQNGVNVSDNIELLYEYNKSFVNSIAWGLRFAGDVEDLRQEGFLGLYEAAQRYIPDKETKFLTYAEYWIRQFMVRYIEKNSSNVRIPIKLQNWIRQYDKMVKIFEREFNRKPTDMEICGHLDINTNQLERVKNASVTQEEVSLSQMVKGTDDDITLEDALESPDRVEDAIIEEIYTNELKADLWGLVDDVCTEEEAEVIRLRYCQNKTLKVIGEAMGITGQNVSQKEFKAIKKLRTGPRVRAFREKYETEMSFAWRGSVSSFKRRGSSTENTAIELYELEARAGLI